MDNLKITKYKTSYWGLNQVPSSPESQALPLVYIIVLKDFVFEFIYNH